jgi:hypothetical protein
MEEPRGLIGNDELALPGSCGQGDPGSVGVEELGPKAQHGRNVRDILEGQQGENVKRMRGAADDG